MPQLPSHRAAATELANHAVTERATTIVGRMQQEPTVQSWREYAVVSLAFGSSRLVLHWLGLQFDFSLDWMWLSDPADLQDRLLQTIYYFHAFPPGMDLFTGILLKVAGAHAALLAQIIFWLFGLVLITSLFYLARACGLSVRVVVHRRDRVLTASAIDLLRASLPLRGTDRGAAVSVSGAVPCRAHASVLRLWLGFFTLCAVIGVTRSTFHLLWLAVMLCRVSGSAHLAIADAYWRLRARRRRWWSRST